MLLSPNPKMDTVSELVAESSAMIFRRTRWRVFVWKLILSGLTVQEHQHSVTLAGSHSLARTQQHARSHCHHQAQVLQSPRCADQPYARGSFTRCRILHQQRAELSSSRRLRRCPRASSQEASTFDLNYILERYYRHRVRLIPLTPVAVEAAAQKQR